jgi:hypothetical protein
VLKINIKKVRGIKATTAKNTGSRAEIMKEQQQTSGKTGETEIAMIGITKAVKTARNTVQNIIEETAMNWHAISIILNTAESILVLRIIQSFLIIHTEIISTPEIDFTGIAMESVTVSQNPRETSITGICHWNVTGYM